MLKPTLNLATVALLAFVVLAAGRPVHGEESERHVELPAEQLHGLARTKDGWSAIQNVYAPAAHGFCFEAEAASSLLGSPSLALEEDGAFGGRYISDPGALEFEFLAATSDRYSVHLRIRKNPQTFRDFKAKINPEAGERRSPEIAGITLDKAKIEVAPFADITDAWSWQQIAVLELSAGFHRLNFGALPGYQLDRVVLKKGVAADETLVTDGESAADDELELLDDVLAEESPFNAWAANALRAAPTLVFETPDIAPATVAKWGRVIIVGDDNGAPYEVMVSADGGERWLAVQQGGDLGHCAINQNGNNRLRVRLTWRPNASQFPSLRKVSLSFLPGPAELRSIAGSDGLQATWGAKSGYLHTLSPLGFPAERRLFEVEWAAPDGENRTLPSSSFQLSSIDEGNGDLALQFAHAESAISVDCHVDPAAAKRQQWHWRLHVKNAGAGEIRSVRLTAFSHLDFGSSVLRPPSLWSVRGRSGVFPGSMSMGWMFVSGAEHGLYLAIHDQSLTSASFEFDQAGDVAHAAINSHRVVMPGGAAEFEFAAALGSNDWHWAADQYRAWAMGWMKRPQWPKWARYNDGWWNLYTASESAFLDRRSTTVFEDARWMGLRHLQSWVGSGDGGFVGRLAYLSPRLGTPAMSAADSQRIRSLGGHIGHYIQAREWDASYCDAPLVGHIPRRFFPDSFEFPDRDWSDHNQLHGRQGGSADSRLMCPSADGWQAWIAAGAEERIQAFGNDAIYLDQLGCTAMTCGDRSHAHAEQYHVSGAGYLRMAERALAQMRQHNPDAVVAQEGVSAGTGQAVHFHLISCLPYPDYGKEFLYTFPDTAIFNGSSNGAGRHGVPIREQLRSLFLMHRFELASYDLYCRQIVLLRQRIHDWQYEARFMDDVGLRSSAPKGTGGGWTRNGYRFPEGRILAKWYRLEREHENGVLITFTNEQKRSGETLSLATEHLPFPVGERAFAYFDDGMVESLRVSQTEGGIVLPVPERKVGALLIPGAVPESSALRCFAFQSTAAAADTLVLGMVNIGDDDREVSWTFTPPAGIGAESSAGSTLVQGGGVLRIQVPLDLNAATAMVDMDVEWTHGKHKVRQRVVLSPPLRNGGMELDVDLNGSADTWHYTGEDTCHIIHRYATDFDMRKILAAQDSKMARSGNASLRLPSAQDAVLTVDGPFGHKGDVSRTGGQVGQRLFVKPSTHYRVTAYAYAQKNGARAALSLSGAGVSAKEVTVNLLAGEWTELTFEFATEPVLRRAELHLRNLSRDMMIWFDDVSLVERLPDAG